MTRQGLLDAIDELNIWKSGGARAPHKPLLLLLMLGRARREQRRLASYADDIKEPLRKLLRDFGPPHKALHPEYPFCGASRVRSPVHGLRLRSSYCG